MTTKLISGTGLQLLRRYDKKSESYRAQLLDDVWFSSSFKLLVSYCNFRGRLSESWCKMIFKIISDVIDESVDSPRMVYHMFGCLLAFCEIFLRRKQ